MQILSATNFCWKKWLFIDLKKCCEFLENPRSHVYNWYLDKAKTPVTAIYYKIVGH